MIREKIIKEIITNKDVLDIGSIGQTSSYSLWEILKEAKTKSLTGIDLPDAKEMAVEKFKITEDRLPKETNIVFGNMETYIFNRQFDVIIAGDVIEHVENQGLFLNNIRKHLRQDGILILTTPNAKWPSVIMKPNETHTLWHDRYTLERILNNCGMYIYKLKYYYGNKKKYFFLLRPFILKQGILVLCKIRNQ
jgi:2-polyprenyl-3-methyl-5-hydroxy-6-metoxy-1,4-benzoquinol methylase